MPISRRYASKDAGAAERGAHDADAARGARVRSDARIAVAAVSLSVAMLAPSYRIPRRTEPSANCLPPSQIPACRAVRGERAEGWLAQSRSPVMARNGIVVTSQPLAAQAGLRILLEGGNAVDAAVATAAALNVTEPMNVGLAGDLFAIVYTAKDRRMHVLDASGTAPSGATIAHLQSLGYAYDPKAWGPGSGMPPGGILDVTVPGAAWGWDEVLRRYGTMKFARVLGPAIEYAQNGFPVSERIAHDWRLPAALPLRRCCTRLDPDSVATWYARGKPPVAGQVYRNPQLARTFRLLQKYGRDVFYKGAIARAIVAKSKALGGTLTLDDLVRYRGAWVAPVTTLYHGLGVVELPPPSRGFAANEALNILATCVPKVVPGETPATLGPANPTYWHLLVEAKKLAYADLYAHNGDPHFSAIPLRRLVSARYAATLCGKIDPRRGSRTGPPGAGNAAGDTIVLSTADRFGNMVSWVNSNYDAFGSGITVPGYGFVLHNRGALFTLDPTSPNAIAPHKRPFNTLDAGFLTRNGRPVMTLGLMGGDMQSQGHEQIVVDVADLGANVQQAGDMARFRHDQVSNTLFLETPLYDLVGAALRKMGHVVKPSSRAPMGGYQAIMALPNGTYAAGSDFGKDGEAVGW